MWMIAATGGLTAQVDWLGPKVGGHLALSLHSSNEPGELSQWHYAINIIVELLLLLQILQTFQKPYFS